MGQNNQPQQIPGMDPQALAMQKIRALQGVATSPYQGQAQGGGAAQGVAQLVAALMAKKAQNDWQKKWGVQAPPAGSAPTPASPVAAPLGVPDA